jgi:general secretion pathway protein A
MYASFFGLERQPFSIAPDPRFLYLSERHREALAHLLYGLEGGGGFVLLTGEVGAGKTTVCRCFLDQLPPHCAVAYIYNPRLSVADLLQTVCAEFGIELPAGAMGVKAPVDALNRFLLDGHAQGRQALLVIDEAQSLPADVLEQLRLLTNLETAERKLLQIVLIGQPELRTLLAQAALEPLAQRVIARYHLGALKPEETRQYVIHRLGVAGPHAPMPFDSGALDCIHRLSGGVPRRINLLADRALLGAYAQGRQRVDRRLVEQAAREVFDAPAVPARRGPWVLPGVAGLGAVVLGAWGLQRQGGGAAEVIHVPAAAVASTASGAAAGSAASAAASASGLAPAAGTAAATATATAIASASSAASAARPLADPAVLLAAAYPDEATAWRELALRWNVAIGEGDPCRAAELAQLACFRSPAGGLPVVRQLGRPGLVSLRRPAGVVVHAVLVALNERQAVLQVGPQRFVLSLPALAGVWRGDYASFWHTPPGWQAGVDAAADPQVRNWVEQQLGAMAPVGASAPLRDRVATFQLVHGLPADGRAGPLTLMQLSRAAGVAEPRLEAER